MSVGSPPRRGGMEGLGEIPTQDRNGAVRGGAARRGAARRGAAGRFGPS